MPDKQRTEAESEVGWAQVATERARTIRDLKAEVERLKAALRGLHLEDALTYEGNLEASAHFSVDALSAARAALEGKK